MSVTFVIGRAGSGKTSRCRGAIALAMRAEPIGLPIYWLVPRQATFNAERELACGSGLAGFCRARVVSFEQLGEDIFAECGGAAIPQVTEIGRQMIIGHLLRELMPQLAYFASSARQAGLAAELDRTFAELERAGKTAADLASLIEELSDCSMADVEGHALRAKLRDVHLLFKAYGDYLGQERFDQHRRLQQMLAAVKNCSFFKGSTIHVDGFLEFTDFQRRMLAAIAATGAMMEVTLLMDPHSPLIGNPNLLPQEMGLFHKTERTYRKLWFAFNEAGAAIAEPVLLRGTPRFANGTLADLEQRFGSTAQDQTSRRAAEAQRIQSKVCAPMPPFASEPEGRRLREVLAIECIEAPDRAAEVDAVCRAIRLLLAQGMRLRDIVVLARDLEPYLPLIATSFDEHEIPYFVDRRRSAGHHPLLEFLRSALRIARSDWHGDSIMPLLKSGLAGVTPDEADELENYVLLHRVRGEAWESPHPWTYQRKMTFSQDPADSPSTPQPNRIDAIRRKLAAGLSPLVAALREGRPMLLRDLARHVFDLFERFNVRQTMSRWIDDASAAASSSAVSSLDQSGEHQQVWTELVELFDEMVDLLGEHRFTPAEFVEILESGLERFDLALAPPTVDQVLIGQVDRTICPAVRAAFVMGLSEREFPAVPRDETVLTDRERRELGRRKIELDPDCRRRILDEPLFGYIAFTRASERLILTRAATDEKGRPVAASVFWREIGALSPDICTTRLPWRREADIEHISTPRQLVSGLMRWVRDGEESNDDPSWRALYQWLAARPVSGDSIDDLRRAAWPALAYANKANLSEATNRSLFPAPLSATVSQLETFAACPFRHFVRHGLRLQSRRDQDITTADLSQVYHRVLEELINQVSRAEPNWDEDPLPITSEMIRAATQRVGRVLRGEFMLGSARNRYLLYRVESTLEQLVASQRELMKRSRFRPKKAGVAFGEDGNLPAFKLTTPGGAKIALEGKIDRVDTLVDGDQVVAFDYRLATGPLSLQKVQYGLSLQLLAHLLVLQAHGQELAGRALKPAAAFYLQLLRSLGDVDHPDEALAPDDPRYLLAMKPRGLFDARSLGDLDTELAEGRSIAIAAYINKQGGFGYKGRTDVAEGQEFSAMLEGVRRRMGELADQILAGRIEIAPFRLGTESPCPRCEFHGVCRFETSVNRYTILAPFGREQVLEKARETVS